MHPAGKGGLGQRPCATEPDSQPTVGFLDSLMLAFWGQGKART